MRARKTHPRYSFNTLPFEEGLAKIGAKRRAARSAFSGGYLRAARYRLELVITLAV